MLNLDKSRQLSLNCRGNPNFQLGATLIETMISIALSLVVTSAMVVLMANTMGVSTRIINMTQLTDEMRNVMSMVTRDVRRANYSANALYCYGHSNCGSTVALQSSDVFISGDTQCITFQLDRSYVNDSGNWQVFDGDATNDPKGGFRRREVDIGGDSRGMIEMWVSDDAGTEMPDCEADTASWQAVTDPDTIDILSFTVNDELSEEATITRESGSSFTQRQRQLKFSIEGEIVLEQQMGWVKADDPIMVRRQIEDTITVRNDYISNYAPPAP